MFQVYRQWRLSTGRTTGANQTIMTREEAKTLLPIITAWANGENIQIQNGTGWCDIVHHVDLQFDCDPDRYRMKPEPREFWLNIYPQPDTIAVHTTKAQADAIALSDRVECIKVREVME